MKYVPVLRYRQQEKSALINVKISTKIMPLIEIVKEIPDLRMVGDFESIYNQEFSKINVPFMVDFPMSFEFKTKSNRYVKDFLGAVHASSETRIGYYEKLKSINNMIPTVSYAPSTELKEGYLIKQARQLRHSFARLAFRIFPLQYRTALSDIRKVIKEDDILTVDLDEDPHNYSGFTPIYKEVTTLAKSKRAHSVLIRSAIPSTLRNVDLPDGEPIPVINNSLLKNYSTYGFDAFGDYAGIKKDFVEDAFGISPGFLYFSWHDNTYIGFRGQTEAKDSPSKKLAEFARYIAPSVTRSEWWAKYQNHHERCPGCHAIAAIAKGTESGASQAKWKGIAMKHYLYTMEDLL